jgi:hypothetical protein
VGPPVATPYCRSTYRFERLATFGTFGTFDRSGTFGTFGTFGRTRRRRGRTRADRAPDPAKVGAVAVPDACPMVGSPTDSSGLTGCLHQMRAPRSSRVAGPAGPMPPVPSKLGVGRASRLAARPGCTAVRYSNQPSSDSASHGRSRRLTSGRSTTATRPPVIHGFGVRVPGGPLGGDSNQSRCRDAEAWIDVGRLPPLGPSPASVHRFQPAESNPNRGTEFDRE